MKKPDFFVRVQSTYAPKNKLCRQLMDELCVYDCALFLHEKLAKTTLINHYTRICEAYQKSGGKAQLPGYSFYKTDTGFGFNVADTIILNGHQVKQQILE